METRAVLGQIITGMDAGFQSVEGKIASLRMEVSDGFRSVDERLSSVERDVAALWAETRAQGERVSGLSVAMDPLATRIATLTERVGGLEKRVDIMSEEMRQRFRVVIERLATLERSGMRG